MMKAKVKATGQVINVEIDMNIQPVAGNDISYVFRDRDGRIYYGNDLDFKNLYPDWQQVRVQASIAAMQGMMAAISPERFTVRISEKAVANASIGYADALIERLKEEMEDKA